MKNLTSALGIALATSVLVAGCMGNGNKPALPYWGPGDPAPKNDEEGGGPPPGSGSYTEFGWHIDHGNVLVLTWPADYWADTVTLKNGDVEIDIHPQDGGNSVRIPGDISEGEMLALKKGNGHFLLKSNGAVVNQGQVIFGDRFTLYYENQLEQLAMEPLVFDKRPFDVDKGQRATISGYAGPNGIRGEVYVAAPKGPVITKTLSTGDLAPGAPFAFDYLFEQEGTYVIEIIDAGNGLAAANIPVYVHGDDPHAIGPMPACVPALDRPVEHLFVDQVDDDGKFKRQDILSDLTSRVNQLRGAIGALGASESLNNTAQLKADQLADAGQFAHATADGAIQAVDAIAAGAGLEGSFTENIAVEVSADRLWDGWYWSPSRRKAMLDPKLKTQGFGIAVFKEEFDWYVCVQHFSTSQ